MSDIDERRIKRCKDVIAELERDYGYEDASVESEEIGCDVNETLVMGLENRAELGLIHLRAILETCERLTTEGAIKDDRIFELEKSLVYLRSRSLIHTEYLTAVLGDNGEKLHPLERVSSSQEPSDD